MTEGTPGIPPRIPPKPRLSPKDLHRQQAKDERAAARAAEQAVKDAKFEQRQALKHSTDITVFNGHHVIGARQLKEAFPDDPDDAVENPVRFRHQLVHGITLTVLAAVLVAAVVLAVLVSRGQLKIFAGDSTAAPTPHCPTGTFDYPANGTVHVNVYNSTRREGLATGVADQLAQRGYLVDSVKNKATNYRGTAVVVSGTKGQGAAFNLQRNVAGAGTDYVQDDRSDATVDIYLTSSYTDLVAPPLVDQTPGQLSCPRFSPTPSATTTAPGSVPAPAAPAPAVPAP
ncbi:LytR C-terminal domain-containing protein [Pseudarthrobacter sp. P1]|uniref:LytR C-terminal domain-containing protein n=1 Tax=Pseudarthrobacter sp. P1 TaxID=3418418 RepID=UPI003CF18FFF